VSPSTAPITIDTIATAHSTLRHSTGVAERDEQHLGERANAATFQPPRTR
jgi:hypothetical protein